MLDFLCIYLFARARARSAVEKGHPARAGSLPTTLFAIGFELAGFFVGYGLAGIPAGTLTAVVGLAIGVVAGGIWVGRLPDLKYQDALATDRALLGFCADCDGHFDAGLDIVSCRDCGARIHASCRPAHTHANAHRRTAAEARW